MPRVKPEQPTVARATRDTRTHFRFKEQERDGHARRHPVPQADLKVLEKLLGTWQVTGGAAGTVHYEWLEGDFFLLQHVDLTQYGQQVRGIEVIGHKRKFGEAPSADIKSRYYDSQGNTFDYVYELEGDTLTIWAGGKGSGSPTYYQGSFSEDGETCTGAWVYPSGGGYDSTMRRLK